MSYENTACPCGGQKEPGTMLCQACVEEFKHHPSMEAFNDLGAGPEYRRQAALILISLSRRRIKVKVRGINP